MQKRTTLRNRLAALALALLVSLSACAAAEPLPFTARLAQPTDADITQAEALDIARPEWEAAIGTADNPDRYIDPRATLLALDMDGETRRVWHMLLWDRNGVLPLCFTVIDAETGDVLGTETFTLTDFHLSHQADPFMFWPLEQKNTLYYFYQSWMMDGMTVGLPDERHMTQDEATALARETLAAEYGVKPEALDNYLLDVNFYLHGPYGAEQQHDIPESEQWVIVYRPLLPDRNGEYPILYQVTMDAATGEVLLTVNELGM